MHQACTSFLLSVAVAIPLAAQSEPRYAYTAVGLTAEKSVALNISNSGNVTGHMVSQPFLYSHDQFHELGTLPGAIDGIGYGVNNSGQVVGYSGNQPYGHAFLYSDGAMRDLGSLGNLDSGASGINDLGQVVGWSREGPFLRAFVYSGGVMHSLGTLPGASVSDATAINNRGQITGAAGYEPYDPSTSGNEHAFLYENGVMRDLGSLGGPNSRGYAINELGEIAGASNITAGDVELQHAFLYANGVMRDLGAPVAGTISQAHGINNLGQVVGWYSLDHGRAFIYHRLTGMRDLSSMVDPASGWFIHAVYSINDRRQIVGLGCKDGQYGAVLLNPVPLFAGREDGDVGLDSMPPVTPENPPCPYG
jgi:probable HAF family extracellular repeat protein